MAITAAQRAKLNNDTPANQLVGLGTQLGTAQDNITTAQSDITTLQTDLDTLELNLGGSDAAIDPLLQINYEIVADASSGLDVYTANVPFAMEIIDVIVQCRAASASGTVTVSDGTNDITNAIVCAVDNTSIKASSIVHAYSTLAAGDTLDVTTNGAADRALVTFVVRKV